MVGQLPPPSPRIVTIVSVYAATSRLDVRLGLSWFWTVAYLTQVLIMSSNTKPVMAKPGCELRGMRHLR
jgi:hypothetical protein